MEKTKFILYKIYYGERFVSYIGQTTQELKDRMYQHFFKDVDLDIRSLVKIEYAYCKSKADLNVYEMYYINKEHPFENRQGTSTYKLTIELEELEFIEYDLSNLAKYKKSDTILLNRSTKIPKNKYEFFQKRVDDF